MPSTSKAQQRLMGQAYAVKKGDIKPRDLDPKYRDQIVDLADSMSLKDLKDFAETKHTDLPSKVKEGAGSIQPSSGTAPNRAGGGFPFGHEYGSQAREADIELAVIAREKSADNVEDEAEERKKKKAEDTGRAKTFDEFIEISGSLQEMDVSAPAASPTNTTGMGNVTPGETGSGDVWGNDEEEEKKKKKGKRAMSNAEWKAWKKKARKTQKTDKKSKGAQTQMAAWELGGRLPVPVVNTIK